MAQQCCILAAPKHNALSQPRQSCHATTDKHLHRCQLCGARPHLKQLSSCISTCALAKYVASHGGLLPRECSYLYRQYAAQLTDGEVARLLQAEHYCKQRHLNHRPA